MLCYAMQAARFETYGLAIAQTLLAGVHLTKANYMGALSLLLLCGLTLVAEASLRLRLGGLALRLPLQRCAELDAAEPAPAFDLRREYTCMNASR